MTEHRAATRRTWIAVVILLLLAGSLNALWLAQHPYACGGQDETHHYLRGLLVNQNMWDSKSTLFQEPDVEWMAWWPPLTYFASALVMKLLGRAQWAMALTGTFFWMATLLFAFGIARRLGDDRDGLGAIAALLFWPILLSYSRQYNLEMGLVATAAGANYFLLASDGFARRPATLAFGLLCGLGLLAKITFPVFIARSLIVVLAQHRRDFDARRGLWLAGALVLAAAVAAFWYLPRLEHIGRALLLHVVGYNREFGPGQAESGAPLLVDAAGKWGPVGVVYFLAALAAYPLFRDRKWLPVWVWMLVPIFVFVIAPSDIVRFALAATPAMAVLAVVFARRVLRGRKVLTVLVIVAWGGLAAASTILASQQMWRLPNASADSARILRAVDSPAPRVCYVQHSADTDFNEEHLRFLLRLHEPRLAFAPFGPGTFHIQHYERLVDCFRRGGAVLFRGGEDDLAWPSRAVLRDIVVGADKHALRQDQGLAKGLFPPDFTFADWPDTPPDGYEKADGIGYRVEDGPPIEFTLFAPRGD